MSDNSLNYDYLNPLKLFINKVWDNNIISNSEENFNKDFNRKLNLVQNLEEQNNYSGVLLDNNFNENNYGLFSLNKINTPNFSISNDKYYLPIITKSKKNILTFENKNKINKIESGEIYSYVIDQKIFDDLEGNYKLEIFNLNSKNKFVKIILDNPKETSNVLRFNSNQLIKQFNIISLIVSNEYSIIDYFDYGLCSSVILEEEINYDTNNVHSGIFYNENEINIISYEKNTKKIIFTGIVDNIINFLKITKKCVIESYKYIEKQITQITFLNNNFNNFYFKNNNTNYEIFIIINNSYYDLKYDYIKKYYFIKSNIFNENIFNSENININKLTTIFKYIKFNNFIKKNNSYAKIKINKPISNNIYNIQKDLELPLNLNFKNNNIKLHNFKIESLTEFNIDYTGEINTIKENKIIHNYRINESVDFQILTVKYLGQYLYKIKNNFKLEIDEKINVDIEILFDFNNIILNNLRKINCIFYKIDTEYIYFIIPINNSLIDYNNNKILNDNEIINNSILDIYSEIILSQEILNKYTIIKPTSNGSILYLLCELPEDFSYSSYYVLPENINMVDNEIISIRDYLFSSNFLKYERIFELIGDYIWNSNSEINTEQPVIIKKREITINYSVNDITLQSNNEYIWGGTSNNNIHLNILNEDIQIFQFQEKKYLIIRSTDTNTNNRFSTASSIFPYNNENSSDIKMEIKLKQIFPISNKYKINLNEFNDASSNISLSKLKIKKLYSNLTSLIKFTYNVNYSYQINFISSNEEIICNILNIVEYKDYFEIDIDKNIVINKNVYIKYFLIEKIIQLKIEQDNYFDLYHLKLKQNLPIHLNKNNPFLCELFWVDNEYNNINYINTYFCKFKLNSLIQYTNEMYLSINKIFVKIVIISLTYINVNNNYEYYILFTCNNNINQNYNLILYSEDFLINTTLENVIDLNKYYTNLFYTLEFYNLNDNNLFVFSEKNNFLFFKFLSILNNNNGYTNTLENSHYKLILRFKYDNVNLIDKSFINSGFNIIEDKKIISVENNKIIDDPIWIKDLAITFFKSIELSINNHIIEKLDYNTMNILYSFKFDIFKETTYDKIVRLHKDSKYFFFYYPLKLFYNVYNKFLPICVFKKADISINFKINKLEDLLLNSGIKSQNIKPKMNIYYTTYILPENIIDQLKCETNILLARINYNYPSFILNKNLETNHIKINNMVKDLFLSVEKINPKYEDTMENNSYDDWYDKYIKDYKDYLNNNEILSNNYNLFKKIEYEILNNSKRVLLIKSYSFFELYDINYIIYLDDKYLNYIDEDLNKITNIYSQKISILLLYFKNIHKIYKIKNYSNGIIDNITLKLNGKYITPSISGKYFNDVIPYYKGYSLDDKYYVYSFSLNSKETQPNGHLNFKHIEDFMITTKLNDLVEKAKLKIYTTEYKILQIYNNNINIIL